MKQFISTMALLLIISVMGYAQENDYIRGLYLGTTPEGYHKVYVTNKTSCEMLLKIKRSSPADIYDTTLAPNAAFILYSVPTTDGLEFQVMEQCGNNTSGDNAQWLVIDCETVHTLPAKITAIRIKLLKN